MYFDLYMNIDKVIKTNCLGEPKKIQMSKFINTELKSGSDSESSDSDSESSDSESSDSDLVNLCFSSSVNYNYILKCIFEGAI